MKQGSSKTDAALRYGFDTYAGFYKAFCREFRVTPAAFLAFCRAKRPYRIDIIKEEYMTVTHKKAARVLQNWNMGEEHIADIYYEGTGNFTGIPIPATLSVQTVNGALLILNWLNGTQEFTIPAMQPRQFDEPRAQGNSIRYFVQSVCLCGVVFGAG